jgi:predicted metal-binding protein
MAPGRKAPGRKDSVRKAHAKKATARASKPEQATRRGLKQKDLGAFVDTALEMGADEVKVIRASTVICEAWVRIKCQFGCGGYNKRLTCPPYTPTPAEMREVVACYKRAILIHADDNDIVNKIIPHLEREIFFAGYFKAFGLGSGPCRLCKKCDTGSRCKHPYQARPSMEACGIDVFTTAHTNGMGIEVVRTRRQSGDYYGVILVD